MKDYIYMKSKSCVMGRKEDELVNEKVSLKQEFLTSTWTKWEYYKERRRAENYWSEVIMGSKEVGVRG